MSPPKATAICAVAALCSKWIRGVAYSRKRRQVQVPESGWIVREDARLRIVPDKAWRAVKARQAAESGARVRRGMRKAAAGPTGRQPVYLFSGLLVCGNCGSKFTIRNPRSYACASWINGQACSNRLQVRRDLVERRLLAQVTEDLSDPAIVAHVEKELRRRLKVRQPKTDPARRRELEREIDNLVAAIATGALRSSPALASRLTAAETELGKIREPAPETASIERLIPRIGERLSRDGARVE